MKDYDDKIGVFFGVLLFIFIALIKSIGVNQFKSFIQKQRGGENDF